MNYLIPLLWAGCAVAADPASTKDTPLDAAYLRTHAQTRGFLLGRPQKPKITPDGKAVLFLRSQARVPKLSLFEFDTTTGKTRELLTPEQVLKGAEEKLSPEEKARRERMRISVGGFTDYQLSEDGSLILINLSGRLYVFNRTNSEVRELKTGKGTILDPKFSPDGKSIAYVKDHDVFVYSLAQDKETEVTKGGTAEKTHGLAEFVAQEEMGRFSGFWWSPDSKYIVYEEADAKGVEVWYVADPAKPGQAPLPSYYPRPGKANVKVRAGIVPVAGGETVWIEWDTKKYEYLTQVRWDKHGPLTITVQTRLQNEIALLKVDPQTGKTTTLLTEKDDTWVNLHQDTPRWFPGGKSFLWTSGSALGPQLEHRDESGNRKALVWRAEDGFRSLLSVNPVEGKLAFLRNGKITLNEAKKPESDPTSEYVQIEGSKVWSGGGAVMGLSSWPRGDAAEGINTAVVANDNSVYILTTTTPDAMPKTTVYKTDDKLIGELPSVAENPGFTPKVEFHKVGDGEGFYAAIVRPHGFDPKKKYPVIVDVYGGPGHQTVLQAMRNWLLPQWLADQGFVVVAFDNRGTPNRGRDWERALYKKFGSVPLDDQVAALEAIGKKFPELDLERVGIVGWSFGGYMSALAVLKKPDVFKAAVAGAPVVDWEDYDTHYTERYMGLPQDNPDAYKEGSLLTYADGLKRPLLLIHGTADDNVFFRHSLKLADALFRAGKDFEILPLSSLTHMVPEPVVMERLWSRIAGHFQRHLGKPRG